MTRKKVKLVYVSNDSARKASLKKRRIGLLKKVSELTILCGVDAFCIIYNPDDNASVVWPSSLVAHHLFMRYINLPDIERCKKSMNQETYLKERIGKAEDQSKRHQQKNRDMDLSYYMQQLHLGRLIDEFSLDELTSFACLVQEKLMDINKRVEYFQQVPPLSPTSFPTYHVPNMEEVNGHEGDHGMVNSHNTFLWDQWFIENVMNNNNLQVGDAGSSRANIGIPYRINLSCSSAMDMGIQNPFYGETDPQTTLASSFTLGVPNLVENFQGGASVTNDIISDNANELQLPHEALVSGVDYGTYYGLVRPIHSNLLGHVGNNIEENTNAASLGIPFGNKDTNGRNQASSFNDIGRNINSRNWDELVLPNENILCGIGNGMELIKITTEKLIPNVITGLGLPGNDQIHGNIYGGGSITRNTDVGLSVGDHTKTWPNYNSSSNKYFH